MIDAMQAWLPDPSQPLSAVVAGLATALAILIMGGALSRLVRGSTDLVTEGAMPLTRFTDGFPSKLPDGWVSGVVEPGYGPYSADAVAMAMSAVGANKREPVFENGPPGCVGCEIKVSIPYGRDFSRAMSLVLDACHDFDGVLEEPASRVRVAGLADSSIELTAAVWFRDSRPGSVTEDLRRTIADRLNEAGFEIPL